MLSQMSTPVKVAGDLIDVLASRGYQPDEDAPEFVLADLIYSGLGSVRAIVTDEVTVYAFDRYMCVAWSARFGAGAPLAAIVAALDAAESDAASGFDA